MIYFITEGNRHQVSNTDTITVISKSKGFELINKVYLEYEGFIGFDIETNGLDPYMNDTLLLALFFDSETFVIDLSFAENVETLHITKWAKQFAKFNKFHTKIALTELNYLFEDERLIWVAHNGKFDLKFLYVNNGIQINQKRFIDTMICSQKLSQGIGQYENARTPKGTPGFYSLTKTIKRELSIQSLTMDKEVRSDFIGMNPETCTFLQKHIIYVADDVKYLPKLAEALLIKAEELNMKNIIKQECYNVWTFAQRELLPVKLDVERWRTLIKHNEDVTYKTQVKLDEWVAQNKSSLEADIAINITGGRYAKKRERLPTVTTTDLFSKEIIKSDYKKVIKGNINWNSSDEVIKIFGAFKAPLPTKNNRYSIPDFKNDFKYFVDNGVTKAGTIWKPISKEQYESYKEAGYPVKAEKQGFKLSNKVKGDEFTINSKKLKEMLIEIPSHPLKDFLTILAQFKQANADISARGENFIEAINKVTGGIHTIYRQCDGLNGRVQSGNMKEGYFNSQNMKNFEDLDEEEDNRYKRCFSLPDYYWVSTDWTGAELIIIAALSGELKLLELSQRDMHSEIATMYWRKVFEMRAFNDVLNAESFRENIKLANEFVVSKKENKELRQHKLSFPVFYGARPKRILQSIQNTIKECKNIHLIDSENIFNWFNAYFPKAMKFLNQTAQFVAYNGYLQVPYFNTIIHFPEVENAIDDAKRFGTKYNPKDHWFKETKPEDARNLIISSFQREALGRAEKLIDEGFREANVKIGKEFLWSYTIHDELNYCIKDINQLVNGVPIVTFIETVMCKAMNDILPNNVKIKASSHVAPYWAK